MASASNRKQIEDDRWCHTYVMTHDTSRDQKEIQYDMAQEKTIVSAKKIVQLLYGISLACRGAGSLKLSTMIVTTHISGQSLGAPALHPLEHRP